MSTPEPQPGRPLKPDRPRAAARALRGPITLPAAKAQIDNGGGTMPAGLVSGQEEEDVLAYLSTIFQQP